jgi:hypothetical protein
MKKYGQWQELKERAEFPAISAARTDWAPGACSATPSTSAPSVRRDKALGPTPLQLRHLEKTPAPRGDGMAAGETEPTRLPPTLRLVGHGYKVRGVTSHLHCKERRRNERL